MKKRLVQLMVMLNAVGGLALGTAQAQPKVPDLPEIGSEPTPRLPPFQRKSLALPKVQSDVVYLVDVTASMRDDLDLVRGHLGQQLVRHPHHSRMVLRQGLVQMRGPGLTSVVPLSPSHRLVAGPLEDQLVLSPDDREDLQAGLRAALSEQPWQLGRSASRRVVLYTDGTGGESERSLALLIGLAQEKGIRVDVVGCSGLSAEGELLLTHLARATGGTFQRLVRPAPPPPPPEPPVVFVPPPPEPMPPRQGGNGLFGLHEGNLTSGQPDPWAR